MEYGAHIASSHMRKEMLYSRPLALKQFRLPWFRSISIFIPTFMPDCLRSFNPPYASIAVAPGSPYLPEDTNVDKLDMALDPRMTRERQARTV